MCLVLVACGSGDATTSSTRGTTPTTQPGAGSTTTTTTTVPGPVADWAVIRDARWLTHGINGIWTDTGERVWETEPVLGPDNLARDGAGGFVWLDVAGLWWLALDSPRPVLVTADAIGELVEVIPTGSGPVARLGYLDAVFVDLGTGEPVEMPDGGAIGYHETGNVTWRSPNGLEAVIEGPEVELDAEGQPRRVIEYARLVVTAGEQVIFAMPAGSYYEPYARIHDFDGQRLIMSRGPYEPALPDETFTVLDLTCADCATQFRAAATSAAFTRAGSEWDGSGVAIQRPYLIAEPLGTDDIAALEDGVYLGFIAPERVDIDALSFDLGVWFSGEEANLAAREDGETEIPVPNDFYIRNRSDKLWTLPVSSSVAVTSVWYDTDTAPDTSGVPVPYEEFVRIMGEDSDDTLANMRFDPWWVTVQDGQIVRLDEQYIP